LAEIFFLFFWLAEKLCKERHYDYYCGSALDVTGRNMSRVLGIGTDLLQVSRIAKIVAKNGIVSAKTTRFAQRILHHQHELPKFQGYQSSSDTSQAIKLLSGSWCVKEALFKSLSPSSQKTFRMKDWYKYNSSEGIPQIDGIYTTEHPNEEFLISISHDSDLITSTVLRQTK
jgi:phosphopantetheine--protein transferase-like protein